MPPRTRKTSPAKPDETVTSAAEAAAAEAAEESRDFTVEFRGEKFLITEERRRSWRAAVAIGTGNILQWLVEVIDPAERNKLIAVGKPGESFADVSDEFFEAVNKVGGQGNSRTSRRS